jgi:predicted GIY-YIG superfamily endonuclease
LKLELILKSTSYSLTQKPGLQIEKAQDVESDIAKLDPSSALSAESIPPPGQYCVYAILCDDGSLYIGYTNDLSRRWREHKTGNAARWTKKHKPQRIAYYELVPSREAAMRLERQWKAPHRRRRLKRLVEEGKAR